MSWGDGPTVNSEAGDPSVQPDTSTQQIAQDGNWANISENTTWNENPSVNKTSAPARGGENWGAESISSKKDDNAKKPVVACFNCDQVG